MKVNSLRNIVVRIVTSSFLSGFCGTLFAAPSLNPVLPLPNERDAGFLLEKSIREPSLQREAPSDDASAEQLATEISASKANGKTIDSAALAEAFTKMSYYLADVVAGRIDSKSDRATAQRNLRAAQQNAMKYSAAAEKSAKKAEAARWTYIRLSMSYLTGSNNGAILREFSAATLPKALRNRANVLLAYHAMNSGNAKNRSEALSKLRDRSGLDAHGESAALILLAVDAAGLNLRLSKIKSSAPAYRNYLNSISRKITALPGTDQDRAMALSLSIWRSAEGNKIDWTKSPLSLRAGTDSRIAAALQERAALQLIQKGDLGGAAQKLETVSQSILGTPEVLSIDQRALALRRQQFSKSTNIAPYEKSLVSLEKKYSDSQVLGSAGETKATNARTQFSAEYLRLVQGEIRVAKSPSTTSQRRAQSVGLATRYHDSIDDKEVKERILADIAAIHVVDKQYRKAVDIYVDLALNGNQNFRKTYLKNAISAQSVLAGWPVVAPWDGFKTANASERERLLDLYGQLQKVENSWPTIAHIGLLQIGLGQRENAFAMWKVSLEGASANDHSNHAAGLMLSTYSTARDWPNVESIARISLARKLSPIHLKKRISPTELLGNALFEGGKSLMNGKDFKNAALKFQEFSDKYSQDKRRHEALYRLAFSYRGSAQYPESMKSMRLLVQQYPTSPFISGALHQAGFWALEQALEEDSIYYHQMFLTRFPNDPRASKIRPSLVQVYEGRGMYAQANSIYQQVLSSKATPQDRRIKASVAMMISEDRYGSNSRAVIYANQVIKNARGDSESLGQAYGVLANYYASNNQFKKLAELEPRLAALDSGNLAVSEALGAVRYYMADHHSRSAVKEIFSLELKDPMATLNTQYNGFLKAKGIYDQVCSGGDTSYCAAAVFKVARLAEDFVSTIEDLQINETLDQDSISNFKNRKISIMDGLASISTSYDDRAEKISRNGMTLPDWTQQILWMNSSDSNFNTLSGKTGHGFVQYRPGSAAQSNSEMGD